MTDRRTHLCTAAGLVVAAGRGAVAGVAGCAGRAAPAAAAPLSPGGAAVAFVEREASFVSGADTIYGSLLAPPPGTATTVPAALLFAGSGPTDRNGNSPLPNFETMETLRNFALALADLGIASLRYDKLGSGETGLASFAANPAAVGFDVYIGEARTAYDVLRAVPEVDPRRLVLLGHSEGGLIALVLANQVQPSAPVWTLVLAAPLSTPYLDTIRGQLVEQYAEAQQRGLVTAEQATAALAELDAIIARLRATGELPETIETPALRVLFTPANVRFYAQVAQYNPAVLAAALPATLPVLILRGDKDQQVSGADVQGLLNSFQAAGNRRAALDELPNVDHVFKEALDTPNPAVDYGNPDLPFSSEATHRLTAFLRGLR